MGDTQLELQAPCFSLAQFWLLWDLGSESFSPFVLSCPRHHPATLAPCPQTSAPRVRGEQIFLKASIIPQCIGPCDSGLHLHTGSGLWGFFGEGGGCPVTVSAGEFQAHLSAALAVSDCAGCAQGQAVTGRCKQGRATALQAHIGHLEPCLNVPPFQATAPSCPSCCLLFLQRPGQPWHGHLAREGNLLCYPAQ